MGAINIILICVIGGGSIVVMMMWVSRLSLYDLFPFLFRKTDKSEDEKWVDIIVNSGLLRWDSKDWGRSWQEHKSLDADISVRMLTSGLLGDMEIIVNGVRREIRDTEQAQRLQQYISHALRITATESIMNSIDEAE